MSALDQAAKEYHNAVRAEALAARVHTMAESETAKFYTLWQKAERELSAAESNLHAAAVNNDTYSQTRNK